MKRKCLGCGKIFEDRLSICQDCFIEIENTRSTIEHFGRGFRIRPFIVARIIVLAAGLANILAAFFLIVLFLNFQPLIAAKTGYSFGRLHPLLIASMLYLILLFFFAFLLGRLPSKKANHFLVKMWADKTWYSVSPYSWRYFKYWLSVSKHYFIVLGICVIIWSIFYMLFRQATISPSAPTPLFISTLYIQLLAIGSHIFYSGLFSGLAAELYFSTNWVMKLKK